MKPTQKAKTRYAKISDDIGDGIHYVLEARKSKVDVLYSRKCRSVADELMQNAGMPLDKVSNAAKVRSMLYFKQICVPNVMSEAMGMVGGARPSTRCG